VRLHTVPRAVALFIALAGLTSLFGCAHAPARATTASGAQPLVLQLPRWPDGVLHDLREDRGNVVLLDVWATWCEPCKWALPTYEEFAHRYADRGFRVYAINVDEDRNLMKAFIEESKLKLPVLVDENAAIAENVLKVKLMPTSFLVDRRGVIRFVHQGFSGREIRRYEAEIELLLAEPR
jgi:cytochrome c biogenesis protein CcmG, thiol:disulfide interchange protein DsbE